VFRAWEGEREREGRSYIPSLATHPPTRSLTSLLTSFPCVLIHARVRVVSSEMAVDAPPTTTTTTSSVTSAVVGSAGESSSAMAVDEAPSTPTASAGLTVEMYVCFFLSPLHPSQLYLSLSLHYSTHTHTHAFHVVPVPRRRRRGRRRRTGVSSAAKRWASTGLSAGVGTCFARSTGTLMPTSAPLTTDNSVQMRWQRPSQRSLPQSSRRSKTAHP
jgi:hypothetical protein